MSGFCRLLRRSMLFIAVCTMSQSVTAQEVSRAGLEETLDHFATLDRFSGGEG